MRAMAGLRLLCPLVAIVVVCFCARSSFTQSVVTLPNFPQTKPFIFPQTKPFVLNATTRVTTHSSFESTTKSSIRGSNSSTSNGTGTTGTGTANWHQVSSTTKITTGTTTFSPLNFTAWMRTSPAPKSTNLTGTTRTSTSTTASSSSSVGGSWRPTAVHIGQTDKTNTTPANWTAAANVSKHHKTITTTTTTTKSTGDQLNSTGTIRQGPTTTRRSFRATSSSTISNAATTESPISTTKGRTTIKSVHKVETSTASASVSATFNKSSVDNSSSSASNVAGSDVFHSLEDQSGSNECSLPNGCGVSSQDKIVGGTLASPHEFPWLAHLIIDRGSRSALCTGFLVTNLHVITAAHCTKGASDRAVRLTLGTNSPTINLSSSSESATDDKNGLKLKSTKIVIHPQYSERSNTNDISIITVDKSVAFTSNVRPICLPVGDSSYAGKTGIISGWGSISEGGSVTKHLMKATVPILRNRDPLCTRAYGNIGPQMICAGGQHMDTCQGDSGGPLMVSEDGIFTAIGIVSFGIGCGRPSTPGIYTRISALKSFIDPQIRSGQTCHARNSVKPANH